MKIYYNRIGSNNKTLFSEKEFRNIIKKYKYKYHLICLNSKFEEAINNPEDCNIHLLLEMTGAKIYI